MTFYLTSSMSWASARSWSRRGSWVNACCSTQLLSIFEPFYSWSMSLCEFSSDQQVSCFTFRSTSWLFSSSCLFLEGLFYKYSLLKKEGMPRLIFEVQDYFFSASSMLDFCLTVFTFIISISIFFFSFIYISLLFSFYAPQDLLSDCLFSSFLDSYRDFSLSFEELKGCYPTSFLSIDTFLEQLGLVSRGGGEILIMGIRRGAFSLFTAASFLALGDTFSLGRLITISGLASLSLLSLIFACFACDSPLIALRISCILTKQLRSWVKLPMAFLMAVSYSLTASSNPLSNSQVFLTVSPQILISQATSCSSLTLRECSQRFLKSFCCNFLYSLFLSRLQVERVLLQQRKGQPIWLTVFLHTVSIEAVISVLRRLKQLQTASCSILHLGLWVLSTVYFLTMASTSSSLRKMVGPMWLWYFFMQPSHPPASRHTQHSEAQNVPIFQPCSHLFIIQQGQPPATPYQSSPPPPFLPQLQVCIVRVQVCIFFS